MAAFIEDADRQFDKLLRQSDDTIMPMPSMDLEPHLLISRVRKHYFEEIIKLLSNNYETHQKLLGKNIYLPSALWRCAKYIELNAVQTCMLTELYRRNILIVIKELKTDTKKGKLNRKLFECLRKCPENEKNLQTSINPLKKCNCECTCNGTNNRKRRKLSTSFQNLPEVRIDQSQSLQNIPKVRTDQNQPLQNIAEVNVDQSFDSLFKDMQAIHGINTQESTAINNNKQTNNSNLNTVQSNNLGMQPMSVESHEPAEDEVMLQLEELFRSEFQPEDDLFEGTFTTALKSINGNNHNKAIHKPSMTENIPHEQVNSEEQTANNISLDERLALLESSGMLDTNNTPKKDQSKVENKQRRKPIQNRWLCEMYFQKLYLHEKLDELQECNRKKYLEIKKKFKELFGDDSDDEEVMSPLIETDDFVVSCTGRMAPFVVKSLSPYFVAGRIVNKGLFKLLARYLIKLIFKCSRYPSEYEIHTFVTDFMQNHEIIRCEADFKKFAI